MYTILGNLHRILHQSWVPPENQIIPFHNPVSYTHLDVYKRQGKYGVHPTRRRRLVSYTFGSITIHENAFPRRKRIVPILSSRGFLYRILFIELSAYTISRARIALIEGSISKLLFLIICAIKSSSAREGWSWISVSYTHLDVYKRQFESISSTTICKRWIHIKISNIYQSCSCDCNTSWLIRTIIKVGIIFIFWNYTGEIIISTIELYKKELSSDIIKKMLFSIIYNLSLIHI